MLAQWLTLMQYQIGKGQLQCSQALDKSVPICTHYARGIYRMTHVQSLPIRASTDFICAAKMKTATA